VLRLFPRELSGTQPVAIEQLIIIHMDNHLAKLGCENEGWLKIEWAEPRSKPVSSPGQEVKFQKPSRDSTCPTGTSSMSELDSLKPGLAIHLGLAACIGRRTCRLATSSPGGNWTVGRDAHLPVAEFPVTNESAFIPWQRTVEGRLTQVARARASLPMPPNPQTSVIIP